MGADLWALKDAKSAFCEPIFLLRAHFSGFSTLWVLITRFPRMVSNFWNRFWDPETKLYVQYRQEILTTFPNFPYYCENRKRWIYLGAPMVDPAEILTGSSYVVSEHGPILGSSWKASSVPLWAIVPEKEKYGKLAIMRKGGVFSTPGLLTKISVI